MAVYGLLGTSDDGTFRPQETITRAQFAALTATALGLPAGKSAKFTDVAEDAWYAAPTWASSPAKETASSVPTTISPIRRWSPVCLK